MRILDYSTSPLSAKTFILLAASTLKCILRPYSICPKVRHRADVEMSSAPLPSKLTLLSSLPLHQFGDKVRFLGWYAYPDLLHLGVYLLNGNSLLGDFPRVRLAGKS